MFLPHFLLKGSLLLGSFSGFRPTRFFNENFDRSLPRVVVPINTLFKFLSSPRGITVFLNLPYGVSFRVPANKGICANQALKVNYTTKQPFEVNDWVCLVHSVKLRFFVTNAGSLHCEKKLLPVPDVQFVRQSKMGNGAIVVEEVKRQEEFWIGSRYSLRTVNKLFSKNSFRRHWLSMSWLVLSKRLKKWRKLRSLWR